MRRTINRRGLGMELVRKAAHVLTGVAIVVAVHTGLIDTALLGLLILLFMALLLYNIRYEQELLTRILSVNRADAKVPGLDILSFLLGCWIVLFLFDEHIAFAAIMVLSVGDA